MACFAFAVFAEEPVDDIVRVKFWLVQCGLLEQVCVDASLEARDVLSTIQLQCICVCFFGSVGKRGAFADCIVNCVV